MQLNSDVYNYYFKDFWLKSDIKKLQVPKFIVVITRQLIHIWAKGRWSSFMIIFKEVGEGCGEGARRDIENKGCASKGTPSLAP